jgi:calcineurin-like phosphoesterase family protein
MKIKLQAGQNIFFTSDTHYNHSNICSATTTWKDANEVTRKFDSLDQMNAVIVNNINAVVGENDILFHLGDWSFGGFEMIEQFRSRLVCKNIHLVLGNHDHHIEKNKDGIQSLFSSVNYFIPFLEITKTINFCLFHYPIASWINMNKGVVHLHGHVHLSKQHRLGQGRSLDVGMDGNDMKPYSLDDILKLVKDQPIKKLQLPSDHHEKRLV